MPNLNINSQLKSKLYLLNPPIVRYISIF